MILADGTKNKAEARRFATQNPWDDPLFRSAIRGPEREQRRAEMQATIDRSDAQRAGKIYERNADPIGEAPAPAKKTPELARDPNRPQYLVSPWPCPGCGTVFETANAVRAHRANCVGLYERRRDGESTAPVAPVRVESAAHAAARVKVDALLADPKTVIVSEFNEPEAPTRAAKEEEPKDDAGEDDRDR